MHFSSNVLRKDSAQATPASASATLAERLGYARESRLLIVNCDDFGSSRSANRAIERAIRDGCASSTTLMVPCPWARIAARSCGHLDVGVHLTLTSEYPAYRWPSLTAGASLHDNDGYLPMTAQEVWARADLDEVERECRAQIDRALEWGVDVTHLDSHMDILQLDRHYFALYMKLAKSYRLPVRLRRGRMVSPFSPIRKSTLDAQGIITTDHFISPPWGEPARPLLVARLTKLNPGVTEFSAHPVEDGDELRAYDTEFSDIRAADAHCLMEPEIRELMKQRGVHLLGFKPLRDLMRAEGLAS
ncbi:MAG: polysaccharide deacetylase family protein [Alphaproteobacteria bacterium]|nr:polysaccharide deacetylase family protein [Alphaproteobacteria bacterium]MBV9692142.1 polysaccharide deacetylase family protein [Alphaproteobacteria bacterium]